MAKKSIHVTIDSNVFMDDHIRNVFCSFRLLDQTYLDVFKDASQKKIAQTLADTGQLHVNPSRIDVDHHFGPLSEFESTDNKAVLTLRLPWSSVRAIAEASDAMNYGYQ